MTQTYTRQSSLADGDTITASLFNDEYNQLVNAFAYSATSSSTGHQHDGTAAEGGNVHTIGDLDFLNKIVADSTNNRWGVFVEVSSAAVEQLRISDGVISPVTDNDIDLGTSSLEFKDLFIDGTAHIDTLDVDVNGTVAGTFGVTGATTLSSTLAVTGAVTGSSTVQGTTITATTAFVPDASDGAALGTSSLEFSDLFLADGAVINFGDDQDVSLTHVADTGLLLSSTDQLQFGDSGTYIYQSADGVLDLVSDTEIEINATTIDINGNVDVSGTLTVAGAVDFGDAALSNVGAVQLDSIAGDGDTNTSITFSGSDVITIATGGSGRLTIGDGALSPVTNNQIDLGTSSLEFKDAFFDGTVTADAFAGPLTGNVTGNASGTAATVTTAAQTNITSLGTLTTLTVDNVIINGTTIGHTGDTDLITVASGIATVAGEVSMTTLDIGGTNVTSTAAELNILDGVTSTAAELNALDGITAVVGELNALDIGSTAVGTAVASKAVILDSNKDYTGVRNLTISGELDAATLDISGAIDVDGAVNFAADVTYADGADIITASAGTSNFRAGVNAGNSIESGGNYNVVVGDEAGTAITTGDNNVAVGYKALEVDNTGSNNTALGYSALEANTTAADNVAVGYKALELNSTGASNTALGKQAMQANTTASNGTAVGFSALYANTTGRDNTAVGFSAGITNTTGLENTALGMYALRFNTTGNTNTALGLQALHRNTTANDNTAVGRNSMEQNLTGAQNTIVGSLCHDNLTTGDLNTALGYNLAPSAVDVSSEIVIGSSITGAGTNTVRIGTGGGTATLGLDGSDTSWAAASDVRLKKDVADSTVGLSFLNALRPITFKWQHKNAVAEDLPQYDADSSDPIFGEGKAHHGFIAQEVKAVIDDHSDVLDGNNIWHEDPDGTQQLSQGNLVPMLVKAIQELSAKIAELEAQPRCKCNGE
jgi:hypothetical protein